MRNKCKRQWHFRGGHSHCHHEAEVHCQNPSAFFRTNIFEHLLTRCRRRGYHFTIQGAMCAIHRVLSGQMTAVSGLQSREEMIPLPVRHKEIQADCIITAHDIRQKRKTSMVNHTYHISTPRRIAYAVSLSTIAFVLWYISICLHIMTSKG